MSEDFIFEEDESVDQSTRRPFLIAVGALATVGVVAVACIVITLIGRGTSTRRAEEIAAIETRNAEIAVTNEAVTRTIAAMETEAARPTDTPPATSTSTSTPIPTNTPRPTDTPVVAQAEEETAVPELAGTSVFGPGTGADTPTPIAPLGGVGTEGGTLPQTGLSTWAASIAAVIFLAIVVVARRLRNS